MVMLVTMLALVESVGCPKCDRCMRISDDGRSATVNVCRMESDARFVDSFDLSGFPCGQGKRVQANKSVDGHPLTVGGVTYEHGFGARPESAVAFTANGGPLSFTARVAIDDDAAKAGSGKSYGQPMATFAGGKEGQTPVNMSQ